MSSTYLLDVLGQMAQLRLSPLQKKVEALKDQGQSLMEDQEKSQTFVVEDGKDIQSDGSGAPPLLREAVTTFLLLLPNAKVLIARVTPASSN